MQKLEDLHSHAAPLLKITQITVPVQVDQQQLRKVLKRLPKGSAAAVTGWTFEHITTVAFTSEDGFKAVHQLINAVLAGELPDWEGFRASRLIALGKKNNGVRPIAIGEVWARLASMCAMAACSEVGPGLAPLQLGVGVPGGAQCLGHAVRAGVLAQPDHVTVQLDWRNAFNCISWAEASL